MNKVNIRPLTVGEAAYISGIIDGEGCLCIYGRASWRENESKSGRNFGVRLQIVNTNQELIDWLKERIGGNVFCNRKRKPNEKPVFDLTLNSNGVRWLMPQIVGFSIGKNREWELIRKALDLIHTGKPQKYLEVRTLQKELWKLHGQRRAHK